jgi:hypothetical protein
MLAIALALAQFAPDIIAHFAGQNAGAVTGSRHRPRPTRP